MLSADAISLASNSPDGSNWDYIYDHLNPDDADGNLNISGGHVDFTWTGDSNMLDFVPQQAWEKEGCTVSCRYGFMNQIHFNNDMFHLDTAGVNWGFGIGAIIHIIADVGLGNIDRSVPIVWW